MIRGTTPTHTFTLPFDSSVISKVRILYSQNDELVFAKSDADATMDTNTISVVLSQQDTLSLDCHRPVDIQLRVLTKGGEALASDIIREKVDRCLDDEVLA